MDLLEKLSKLKLKQPKGIKKYIYNETNYKATVYSGFECIETMEKWRDVWILRVFAFNLPNKKEGRTYENIEIVEVQRKILGYKSYLVTGNAWSTMGGRRISWVRKQCFYEVKKNWEFHGYKMYDYQEVINDLDIPYCSWDEYRTNEVEWGKRLRFIDYLTLYTSEPKIERLVKMNLGKYITSIRYLNLDKRKIYDVFKIPCDWEFVIGDLAMSDILILRKESNIKNLDDLELYKQINATGWHSLKRIRKYTSFKKMISFAERMASDSRNSLSIYEDYLRFAEKLGLDLRRNNILYPSDLMKSHDKLMGDFNKLQEEIELEKAEKNKSKFYERYKKNLKHIHAEDGYLITPVRTQEEIINESKILDHCVRTYADQVIRGETEILFVRRETAPDEPFITVEVRNKTLRQARGSKNSSPSEEVKDFLMKWASKNKIVCAY